MEAVALMSPLLTRYEKRAHKRLERIIDFDPSLRLERYADGWYRLNSPRFPMAWSLRTIEILDRCGVVVVQSCDEEGRPLALESSKAYYDREILPGIRQGHDFYFQRLKEKRHARS